MQYALRYDRLIVFLIAGLTLVGGLMVWQGVHLGWNNSPSQPCGLYVLWPLQAVPKRGAQVVVTLTPAQQARWPSQRPPRRLIKRIMAGPGDLLYQSQTGHIWLLPMPEQPNGGVCGGLRDHVTSNSNMRAAGQVVRCHNAQATATRRQRAQFSQWVDLGRCLPGVDCAIVGLMRVSAAHYYVGGDGLASFDSRYIGWVAARAITHRAQGLWIGSCSAI